MANKLYEKARTKFLNAIPSIPITDVTDNTISPIVVTTDRPHGFANAETVFIAGVGGNTAANGMFTTANVSSTTFELLGTTGTGDYTSGGEALATHAQQKKRGDIIRWGVTASGGILVGDDILLILVDSADYTPNTNTHEFLSSIDAGARVAVSSALTTKTVVNGTVGGVADAADVVFPTVTGDPSDYLVGVKSTGVDATSPLIFIIDTATGLPVTPNGGDITVAFDSGDNLIFKL